ncbi:MAG: hypothetical protein V9G20_24830 [Candidatus Promineifilaceae bacterium]
MFKRKSVILALSLLVIVISACGGTDVNVVATSVAQTIEAQPTETAEPVPTNTPLPPTATATPNPTDTPLPPTETPVPTLSFAELDLTILFDNEDLPSHKRYGMQTDYYTGMFSIMDEVPESVNLWNAELMDTGTENRRGAVTVFLYETAQEAQETFEIMTAVMDDGLMKNNVPEGDGVGGNSHATRELDTYHLAFQRCTAFVYIVMGGIFTKEGDAVEFAHNLDARIQEHICFKNRN